MRKISIALLIACVSTAGAIAIANGQTAGSQNWPNAPLHVIVPWPPGSTDVLGRLLQPEMQKDLGQPVLYENKPGANGYIGTEYVARAPADGYTILLNMTGSVVMGPLLSNDVKFDVERDFAPLSGLSAGGWLLTVRKSLPVNTLAEFIAYAKANPGKLNYGSPGLGSMPHVVGASLARAIGTEMIHVPYRGMVPVMQAMSGGELDSSIMPYSAVKNMLEKGEVKVLAFDGADVPSALAPLPDLTKVIPDFQTVRTLLGFWVPAKTPKPIIDRLNKSIRDATKLPEARARLAENVDPIIIGTPEEFGAMVSANAAVAKKVVGSLKAAGVKFE